MLDMKLKAYPELVWRVTVDVPAMDCVREIWRRPVRGTWGSCCCPSLVRARTVILAWAIRLAGVSVPVVVTAVSALAVKIVPSPVQETEVDGAAADAPSCPADAAVGVDSEHITGGPGRQHTPVNRPVGQVEGRRRGARVGDVDAGWDGTELGILAVETQTHS